MIYRERQLAIENILIGITGTVSAYGSVMGWALRVEVDFLPEGDHVDRHEMVLSEDHEIYR